MTKYTLQNGQSLMVANGQWNGDNLQFDGSATAPGSAPTVTFSGSNTLTGVTDSGAVAAAGIASISLLPSGALTTGSLTVSDATLSIIEQPGSGVTFDGSSQIRDGGTLTVMGYSGLGAYTVNGTMSIGATSTVNMDYVAVSGTGKFHLTAKDALLRLGTVGAGDTVVLDGGMLSLTNGMTFLGTITDSTPTASRIGMSASVDVYNAMTAVQEAFDQATGVLQLLNAQGAVVTDLKFAGTGNLYATPTIGLATNYIAISSHPSAGALPSTFTS